MPLEIEVKFSVSDFAPLRRRLAEAGAEPLAEAFEENIVFDTPSRRLKEDGILLRLRRTDKAKATLKLPPGQNAPQGFKTRLELETGVADFDAMADIFRALGYPEQFRYEKYRETRRLGRARVCLDETPFGAFVEIEGEEGAIVEAASVLGLDMKQASSASYHDLNLARLKAAGLPLRDGFVFAPERREALKKRAAAASGPAS